MSSTIQFVSLANADEAARVADVREEILATEYNETTEQLMAKAIESTPYTTTALVALASWLSNQGDEVGANLIREFCTTFAEHEATIV